jgi:hypothetical protein
MPAIYVNMPFVVEARLDDPDHFPNAIPSYTWSVVTQPPGANLVFLNTNSVTPTVIVDTPGAYSVALTAFDGAVSTTANYNFTATASYARTAYASGSCASTGSGLSTTVQLVAATSSSILSQDDANAKAAASAASALGAVLSCCPASLTLTLPSDAPPGAAYTVAVLAPEANPNEDFGSGAGFGEGIAEPPISFIVGSGVSAGSTVELFSSFAPLFTINDATQLFITVQETSPFGLVVEPATFDLALAPAPLNGNLAGATLSRIQKKTVGYAPTGGALPSPNRALGYRLALPNPASLRASLTLSNQTPGLGPWAVDASGWDWVAGYGTANALGVFLLTGGSLAAPTSEVLILGMNPANSEPALLNSYYNFYGYSQLPYQGSLYSPLYTDRRPFASIPHTGFINTLPSPRPVSWAEAVINYIRANNVAAPWNVYFRAGTYGSGIYSWVANSIPLNLERNPAGNVTIGSLTGAGTILAATNGVLQIQAAALSAPSPFFATVAGAPTLLVDLYRFATGFPSAVQLGGYSVAGWPAPTGGTRQFAIAPGPVAGRGYDITNLLSNQPLLNLLTANGTLTVAFYLETNAGIPLPNSFPLLASNLTAYAPVSPMYTINSIAAVGNLPAGTNNVLFVKNPGTKVLLASANG